MADVHRGPLERFVRRTRWWAFGLLGLACVFLPGPSSDATHRVLTALGVVYFWLPVGIDSVHGFRARLRGG